MSNRVELEKLIVTELSSLKGLESDLDQRFAELRIAPAAARADFLTSLVRLESRARGLEVLIEMLDEPTTAPRAVDSVI